MDAVLSLQGRSLTGSDLESVRSLLKAHPGWSRWRLSRVLCEQWDWRNGAGALKDMAARSLLRKLQERGLIALPAKRRTTVNRMKAARAAEVFDSTPIACSLSELGALEIREVSRDQPARWELASALAQHHYLGYGGTVGENAQYAVRDASGRLLGGLVFGSSAWKCQERDEWIS